MSEPKIDLSVVIGPVRLAFPSLIAPRKMSEDSKQQPKYEVQLLIAKSDTQTIANIKRVAAAAARKKWADQLPKGLKSPLRDGDEKDYKGYPGNWYLSCRARDKPGMVDQNVQPIIDIEKFFYGGAWVRAELGAFAYEARDPDAPNRVLSRGVNFGINNLQFVKHGEKFGGRKDPASVFDAIEVDDAQQEGAASEEDDDFPF